MELHVNTAHLDFLTPESEDGQYLESGGRAEWDSLWELDKVAGEGGSPLVTRRTDRSLSDNPFVDSDVSDTEADTTVCSVVDKKHSIKSSPESQYSSPKRMKPSGSVTSNSPSSSSSAKASSHSSSLVSSPQLNKSQLSLPIKSTVSHSPERGSSQKKQYSCPLCSYTDHDSDSLQTHVNKQHLDRISPADTCHTCPLCNDKFDNVKTLETHVSSAHPDIVGHDNSAQSSSLSCPVCGSTAWSSSQELQAHVDSHFSPPEPEAGTSRDLAVADQLLAQEIQMMERNRLKRQEEAEFASLKAQYGMDEQGNYVQQGENSLRKAVAKGKLSVMDYYEKKQAIAESERDGVDDGSSMTRNVTSIIAQASNNVNIHLASKTDHYGSSFGDKGWGCGYRNLQMLLSSLLYSAQFRDVLAAKILVNRNTVTMPSISTLQRITETAWREGFDRMGCEQLGGKLVNTRKWIGATEVYSFLTYCGLDCQLVDFHRPSAADGGHPAMFQWLAEYFQSGGVRPPVYLQHQGHSRTVAGVETSGAMTKLLVLDPSHYNLNSNNIMRLVRKTINSMKSKQYQIVVVRGVIQRPEVRETRKIVTSTRIPP